MQDKKTLTACQAQARDLSQVTHFPRMRPIVPSQVTADPFGFRPGRSFRGTLTTLAALCITGSEGLSLSRTLVVLYCT